MDAQEREKQRIERLRARNEDRAKRLLNAKLRIYGRDNEALEKQKKDKEMRELMEKERNVVLDQKRAEEAKILIQMEKEAEEARNREVRQLAAYHKAQQAEKHIRDREEREFRRSDANVDREKTLFLHFHGEDLGIKQRKKLQQSQQLQWIAQQLREREAAKKAKKETDKHYVSFTATVGGRCDEAEVDQGKTRMQAQVDNQEYNKRLALAKKTKQRQRKLAESKMNEEEANRMKNNPLLVEDMRSTYRTGNPNRRVPYHFKGFSQDEHQRILDERAQQIQQKERARQQEQEESLRDSQQQEEFRRQLVRMERERHAQHAVERQQLANFHQQQKLEKNMATRQLNDVVYRNPIQPEFFDQFGKSCR